MTLLGEIMRLQVQRSTLKVPAGAAAAHPVHYDPGPLFEVASLLLAPGGSFGVLDSGEQIMDVHHTEHPHSKNANRRNDLSLGFSQHYAAMRQRFGAHLVDGIAGENILVRSNREVNLDELAAGVLIETKDAIRVTLESVIVAEPCVPFTRFSLSLAATDPSGPDVTEGLRFLREGRRAFYATYEGTPIQLRLGDRVYACT
jgi:hypothetical protein